MSEADDLETMEDVGARFLKVHAAVSLLLVVLISCDPGYKFTVENPCDQDVVVDFLADPHELTKGSGNRIPAKTTQSYSVLDMDDESFGIRLLSGPRRGDVIRSTSANVSIPEDACP